MGCTSRAMKVDELQEATESYSSVPEPKIVCLGNSDLQRTLGASFIDNLRPRANLIT